VDILEMKTYGEINPDETPIVALGCGHFFTMETLDALVGMGEVYMMDKCGEFTGLKDLSIELARSVPVAQTVNAQLGNTLRTDITAWSTEQ
jgi:hypothetical protein